MPFEDNPNAEGQRLNQGDVANDPVATARQLLVVAEQRFGPCAQRIAEIEIRQPGPPEIWFEFHKGAVKAMIQINAGDENQRWFQLSQEVAHCLGIVPPEQVTYFEEGLTQLFAHTMAVMPPQEDVRYDTARAFVEALEALYPNAVRSLRKQQPYISRITPEQIIGLCPKVPVFR